MSTHVMSYGTGRVTAGEEDFIVRARDPLRGPTPRTAIFLGGRGSTARINTAWLPSWIHPMVATHQVASCDAAGPVTWGNPASRTSLNAYVNYLSPSKPVGLILTSMGGLVGLNWARANPTRVAWVAAVSPALNLDSLKQVLSGTFAAEINTAYGGLYTNANQGLTSNPWSYRASLPGTFPISMWTTYDDEICLAQWAVDFAAANPGRVTHHEMVQADGSGYNHGGSVAPALPQVIDWVNSRPQS